MENSGRRIDVQGVPDILPADRMIDKLLIHFLRPRHGGGEVLAVLYPFHRPGQARVTFEEADVAARVLQQSSHMLEVDNQQFPLRVKASDHREVDLPVQATIHLSPFPDKEEVLRLLSSHGFVTELQRDQVCVSGSFAMLRAVKARLEKLLKSQTQTQDRPYSSSPILNDHNHSPGSKNYTNDSSRQAANRSPFKSGDKPSYAPLSSATSSSSRVLGSPPISPEYGGAQSPGQDHRPSPRSGSVSFIAEADVLHYAQRFRKDDIAAILVGHTIKTDVFPEELGLCNVTLLGRNAKTAVDKLQSLLNNLSDTLRIQEVPLVDIPHDSQEDVAKRIQRYENMYNSVLIRQLGDTIRLVGPSAESYALKQRLLGMPLDQSASVRTGRTSDRGSKRRSLSLPRLKENTERAVAISSPRPVGARGYSPSRYQGDEAVGAQPEQGAGARPKQGGGLRGRSFSESREKVEKAAALRQEKESKSPPAGSTKILKSLMQNLNPKEIKLKLSLKAKKKQ